MKFLADRTLGKLAKRLRALGYDTVYYRGEDPRQLTEMAHQQGRTLLTRNARLIPKEPGDDILLVEDDDPHLQLRSLIKRRVLSLEDLRPFTRCLLCNTLLKPIPQADTEGKVPDHVFYHEKEFYHCQDCSRIYWRGSHHKNMQTWLKELFACRAT